MNGESEDDTDADRDEGTATGPPDAPAGDGDTDPSDEREEPTAEGSDPDSPGTEPGRAVPDDSDGSGTDADPDSDGRPEVDADPSSPAGDAQSRDGNGDTESFLTEAGAGDGSDAPAPGQAPDTATQEDVEHAVEDVDVAESPDGTAPAADALGGIDTDEIDAEELPFGDDGDAPDPEEAFEEVDVGTVDEEEQVWSRIEDDDSTEPSPTPGSDGDADGRRETVVPKNTYCERCEHFSPPPRMECTHEGSAIVDLVDRKHVRVADCPIVEERDALGERRTEADEEEESGVFVE